MSAGTDELVVAQAHLNAERYVEAERAFRAAMAGGASPMALNGLGITLAKQGRVNEAEQFFRRAIQMDGGFVPAYENLARCCRMQDHFAEAEQVYRTMIQRWPGNAGNYDHLGWMLREQKRQAEAVPLLQKAVEIQPGNTEYRYHLGLLYNDLYDLENALGALNAVILLHPHHKESRRERAVVLWRQNKFDEAARELDAVLAEHPTYLEAFQGRAELRLLMGELGRGFKEYECRWDDPDFSEIKFIKKYRPHGFPRPQWKGEDISGKTLLVYGEQGFGDVIQFIRYLPMVVQRGAKCILQVPGPLKSLMEQLPGVEKVILHGEKDPAYDLYVSLMSLPAIMGTTLENVPADAPYLRVPERIRESWQRQMAEYGSDLKVGLCWAGRPDHYNDARRSSALKHFAPLAGVPNVKFFSLQKGPAAAQAQTPPAGLNIINISHRLSDFVDTAGMIEQLDLVISVDTSVVHLAGALGKKVWTMIPFTPEWRWMIGRSDTPWYPTMRLFRQTSPGDWVGIFERAAEELRELSAR